MLKSIAKFQQFLGCNCCLGTKSLCEREHFYFDSWPFIGPAGPASQPKLLGQAATERVGLDCPIAVPPQGSLVVLWYVPTAGIGYAVKPDSVMTASL
jgi:hypothetical protein